MTLDLKKVDYELGELDYAYAIYDKVTRGFRDDGQSVLDAVSALEQAAAAARHKIAGML